MNLRTAVYDDWQAVKEPYIAVTGQGNGIARNETEITDSYIQQFTRNTLEGGLMIVAEHPHDHGKLIAEIHASKSSLHTFNHVMTDLTLVVHPEFQGKKVGRTIFTIFLEEIALNRSDIGKIELFTRESNTKAINLYQSLGFRIEGRLEMRIKLSDGSYEADIPMGWQNPNFEFN